jgi:hypothetical protein
VTTASPRGRSLRASLRELLLWPLLPAQLYSASKTSQLSGTPFS